MRMNLPNQITTGRFLLSLVVLGLLARFELSHRDEQLWLLEAAFWLFIVCALGDILDGYLARRQNQVTSFGRILDPFADKILVCGAFILLLGRGYVDGDGRNVTGLSAWMVVIIVARELLVSSLRGFSEAAGKPYGANYWGKTKMLVQCVTVPLIIRTVGPWRDVEWAIAWRTFMIWGTVIVTALSVGSYLAASRKALMEQSRG
ncbi:MAG: CDP-diacylglycerol--glycerol-3-phosphate 3-phosphatidyltransferase [Planctomycetota bacterium]|nr:MAG: CDP-diacylglycerol--glycerol-3-phosphate 3-phosphatidyltransferase [Planctomycetota bacterium]